MIIINRKTVLHGIGERVKIIRMNNHLSIAQMHQRLGITRDCYYKIEAGLAVPNLDMLRSLMNVYGISLEWVLFGTGGMFNPQRFKEDPNVPKEVAPGDFENLFNLMQKDPRFKHEILGQYYKYIQDLPS
jgi:transcriptional regulator with XRE-family HTH domain